MTPKDPGRVETAALFGPLHERLIELLRGLAPADWERKANHRWTVREVACHLLDGDLRRLSHQRDGRAREAPPGDPGDYDALVAWLDRRNARWIEATRDLSPRAVTELLEGTGPRVAELFRGLDPDDEAPIGVSWAGEASSDNWLDVGREYVERWHHQQQIRDAAAASPLTGPRWLGPLLGIAVHAVPPAYAGAEARPGARVAIDVPGEGGGSWVVERVGRLRRGGSSGWRLREGTVDEPDARVRIEAAVAWRLFLRGLPEREVRLGVETEGDQALAEPLFGARALMVRREGRGPEEPA